MHVAVGSPSWPALVTGQVMQVEGTGVYTPIVKGSHTAAVAQQSVKVMSRSKHHLMGYCAPPPFCASSRNGSKIRSRLLRCFSAGIRDMPTEQSHSKESNCWICSAGIMATQYQGADQRNSARCLLLAITSISRQKLSSILASGPVHAEVRFLSSQPAMWKHSVMGDFVRHSIISC